MVYSNAPIPFSRGSVKPRVFLHNIIPDFIEPFPEDSRSSLVLDALHHQISGGCRIEAVLEAAASAAQDLTSASGAAIAMGRGDTVVCVGRSGETAPPLAARVSVESGISGECIRTANNLICDDTQLDSRVDANLCLSLGLRSLAAVRLSTSEGMVGLLEVFSNYPANFSKEHLELLKRLGGLIELAYVRGAVKITATESALQEQVAPEVASSQIDESLAEPRTIDWLRDSQERPGERKFPFWAIPVSLILLLLSFRGWMLLHDQSKVSVPSAQPAPQELELTVSAPQKPAPARGASKRRASKAHAADSQTPETPEVVVRNFENGSGNSQAAGTAVQSEEDSSPPPQLPVVGSDNGVLSDLVARQVALPKAAMMVSQGVVRGSITHKVAPTYPSDALSDGLSGTVVLTATINEKGAVDGVKAVSGPPVLAQAAMDAVRQWRYQPSLLNATPVRVETEITVNFKKP